MKCRTAALSDPAFVSKVAVPPFDPTFYTNLLAWWKADSLNIADGSNVGAANNWLDSSGNGHNLTTNPNSPPVFHTNQVGSLPAISFNGANSSLGMSSSLTLTNFTIMVAYASASGADGCILGNQSVNRQARINRLAANVCQFFDGSTEAISQTFTTSITSNRLVSWVRSGTAVTFYENKTSRTGGTSGNSTTFDMIGQSSSIFFGGKLFEMAIYDRLLTSGEVTNLYDNYYKARWALP